MPPADRAPSNAPHVELESADVEPESPDVELESDDVELESPDEVSDPRMSASTVREASAWSVSS